MVRDNHHYPGYQSFKVGFYLKVKNRNSIFSEVQFSQNLLIIQNKRVFNM